MIHGSVFYMEGRKKYTWREPPPRLLIYIIIIFEKAVNSYQRLRYGCVQRSLINIFLYNNFVETRFHAGGGETVIE